MERWNLRNKYLVFLCLPRKEERLYRGVLVTLWQEKKNATKTLRRKIAQKENEEGQLG